MADDADMQTMYLACGKVGKHIEKNSNGSFTFGHVDIVTRANDTTINCTIKGTKNTVHYSVPTFMQATHNTKSGQYSYKKIG